MHTELDGQIAGGLREGNPDAWGALYQTHFDAVWRSVARLVGPNAANPVYSKEKAIKIFTSFVDGKWIVSSRRSAS